MISICGTYFLNYNNGTVTGPIADGVNELPYSALAQFIGTCLAMELPEIAEHDPRVNVVGDELIVDLTGSTFSKGAMIRVIDAAGREVLGKASTNKLTVIPITTITSGVHLVRIDDGIRSRTIRIMLP